jgi:hypothetical protein
MSIAPKQVWAYVEAQSRASEAIRLRSMTPPERFAVYADMYNTLWTARKNIFGDWEQLDQWRWQEKLALRIRMVDAFAKLDQWRAANADA